jgi:hypothetical protein
MLRGFVTLGLLGFCVGIAVFILPTLRAILENGAGEGFASSVETALGVAPWLVLPMILGGAAVTLRADVGSRTSTAVTAQAAVDATLMLWLISIGLALLDFVITVPKFS